MKKIIVLASLLTVSLISSQCYAWMDETTVNKPGEKPVKVYESSTGNKYQYDLSNPADKIRYNVDPVAKIHDKIIKPITPSTKIDDDLGQHGGGLIKD